MNKYSNISNSNLEEIFENTYEQIKPNMLKKEIVSPRDEILIKDLGKSLVKSCVFNLIGLLFFLLGLIWLFIYEYFVAHSPIDSYFYFSIVSIGTVFYANFIILKKLIAIVQNKYNAQYGVVKSKYSLTTSTSGTNKATHYCVNVNFPFEKICISKVITSYENYIRFNDGSSILVISFDNKKAYSVFTDM